MEVFLIYLYIHNSVTVPQFCTYVFSVLQHLTISDVYQNAIIYYKKTLDII